MSNEYEVIEVTGRPPESLARVEETTREPFRIGAVQQAWNPDPATHRENLAEGIRIAAGKGADLICLRALKGHWISPRGPPALSAALESSREIFHLETIVAASINFSQPMLRNCAPAESAWPAKRATTVEGSGGWRELRRQIAFGPRCTSSSATG